MPKYVTIEPVAEPSDFKAVKFTIMEWKAAKRAGAKSVPYATAKDALKYGKGVYQIRPEQKTADLNVKIGGMSLDEMDGTQLKLAALSFGITLKKQMKTSDLRSLLAKRLDAIELVDDEVDPGE